MMTGLRIPDGKYRGRFRGERGLETARVWIGAREGVGPAGVARALAAFERTLHSGGSRSRRDREPTPRVKADARHPTLGRRSADTVLPNQDVRGDAESVVQFPDHLDRERATAIENLGNASPTAKEWFEFPASQPSAFHVVEQRVDWVRRLNRLVLRLEMVHEGGEDFQSVAGGRPWFRIDQTLDLLERGTMISFCLDWANLHGTPHTVATSIRSYALCVPMNRT
jgi:hypothetical protein